VVDVAHDRDDRRARSQVLGLGLHRLLLAHLVLERPEASFVAELLADVDGELRPEGLVHRGHDPAGDEELHDVAALDVLHLLPEVLHRDALGQRDLA
jgi:hypothetical protein